jgi:PGF-CTERM protein
VRFEPAPEARVASLKRHARTTQRPFERFVAEQSGISIERQFWAANAALVSVDLGQVGRNEILDIDTVTTVHPNYAGTAHSAADGRRESATDAGRSQTDAEEVAYHLDEMDIPQTWEVHGTRGEGVDVAVLDTGIDTSGYEELAASLERGGWAEFDESGERVDSEPNAQTDFPAAGHGTGVSGVIAGGATDDGVTFGVAPEVNLYKAQIKSQPPEGIRTLSVFAAIEWAIEQDVDIISMSLGLPNYNRAFVEPVRNAIESGILVVSAVGNSGRFTGFSPANIPGVLSAGAIDDDRRPYENTGGERVDTERYWGDTAADSWPEEFTVPTVSAPGVDMISPVLGGEFGRNSGTSFSAPCVAGVAALAMAATDADAEAVKKAIAETARHPAAADDFDVDPGHDDRYGQGIVSALAAISRLDASETLSGTVTDTSGSPVGGVTVASETGPVTETDSRGEYDLPLPPGTQPVSATGVGVEPATTRLDPADTDTRAFQLTRTDDTDDPNVEMTDRMSRRVDPGATATVTFDAANVETATVEAETDGLFGPEQLELSVDGTPAAFGESVSADSGRTQLTVSVSIPETARIGQFRLSYEFTGGDASVTGEGHRVYVHPDPYVVSPAEPPTLQGPVDLVAPRTTIELTDGEGEVTASAGEDAGLVIDKPLTLTAADGATPTVRFSDDGAEQPAAVLVTANDVTLSGLVLDAEGATRGVQVARDAAIVRPLPEPTGVTVRDLAISGADTAVHTVQSPALRITDNEITAKTTGVSVGSLVPFRDTTTVSGRVKTTVRRNAITDVETGIDAPGRVAAVEGNTLSNVGGAGIRVGTPRFLSRHWGQDVGPVRSNTVTAATRGIVVSGVMTLPVEENSLSDITETALVVAGDVLAPIRANSVDGARTGLDILDGASAPTVTGNEFSNIRDPGDDRGADDSEPTTSATEPDTADETVADPQEGTTEPVADPSEGTDTAADGTTDPSSSAPVPGFGIGGALAGLAGASYLLRRRLVDDGPDAD